jgi:hypothetical protein
MVLQNIPIMECGYVFSVRYSSPEIEAETINLRRFEREKSSK